MRTTTLLLSLLLGLATLAPSAHADYIIPCKSNGFPSEDGKDQLTRQVLYLQDGKIKLQDTKTKRFTIVRHDLGLVWECDPQSPHGKVFTQTSFERLNQVAQDTWKHDEERRRALMEKLDGDDLEEAFEMYGFREDGKVVPRVVETGEEKTIAGYQARQVEVYRNSKKIFDLWITDELPRPDGLIKVYEAMGAFRPQVIEKVKALEGFPLAMEARVEMQGGFYDLQLDVSRIIERDVPDTAFELPADYQPKPQLAAQKKICHQCGEPATGSQAQSLNVGAKRLWFCSNACLEEFLGK